MKETCLFCGSDELLPYALGIRDHLRIAQARHDSYRCQKCGSLRLVPLPTQEYLAKVYPQECHFHKDSGSWPRDLYNRLEWWLFYQPVLRSSAKLVSQETGVHSGRVLDVGCGNGLRLQQLSKAGYETEGVDFASINVQYAREVLGLKVWEANVEETGLPLNRYHLLLMYWVMEHLGKPADLVRKAKDSLLPEGWGIFAVPLADSWVSRLFRQFWGQIREAPRHIGIPSSRGMVILLENQGFKNIKARPVSTLELAGDVALTLWPRGNFFMTTGKWAFLKILDRMMVGLLTFMGIPLILLFKALGVKQGLTVFFAQKRRG